MQQNIIKEVLQWLPEIDPCKIELDSSSAEKNFRQDINKITEKIHTWAISILEKANLPSTSHEAKPLLTKYDPISDEGCALNIVIELDAMQASIRNTDSNTAALTGMKLFEAIWNRAITKMYEPKQDSKNQQDKPKDSLLATSKENKDNIKLYQKTINELKVKYPHCNVNALRLLASTRLNVTKQQLDDLRISPQ